MKCEIAARRRPPTRMGYVLTEFTDASWESNGLLDFDRQPQAYYDRFVAINSGTDWAGALLRWGVDGAAEGTPRPVPALQRGIVAALGMVAGGLPAVDAARSVLVTFTLDREGQPLAQNQLDPLVLPAAARQPVLTASY